MTSHDSASLTTRVAELRGVVYALLVLSWVFLALRIWTRSYVKPNFGWDDMTMLLAGMVYTAFSACIIVIGANGGGTHVTDIYQLIILSKAAVAAEALYIATMMVLKISLGIFFARLVAKRWQFVLIYATVGITSVSGTASFFYCLFRCGPDLDQFLVRQLSGTCTPIALDRFFLYQQAVITLATDCVFALLPFPLLWNSNMNRSSKFSIGLILSLAALGCVCSAIRFQYLDGMIDFEGDDFFWHATLTAIWSTIEPGAGIVAGCMATLSPLIKRAFQRLQMFRPAKSQIVENSRSANSGITSSCRGRASSVTKEKMSSIRSVRGCESPEFNEIRLHGIVPSRTSMESNYESTECIFYETNPDQQQDMNFARFNTGVSRAEEGMYVEDIRGW